MARSKKSQHPRFRVAVIGDGETESIYFNDIRNTDRPANLTLVPEIPRKIGNYKGILERAEAMKEDYDSVYALIDMDKVIHDNQRDAYDAAKAKAIKRGVIVLENNPCFEIWLLMHFQFTGKLFDDCDDVSTMLKKHIPDYNKSQKFLTAAKLYKTYGDKISEHAIPNSRKLENYRAEQDELYPRAEVFQFFEWYLGQLQKQ